MSALYAGVDLGGTNIKAACADEQGNVLVEDRVATDSHEGPEAVLHRIADLVLTLADRAGGRPACVGVGVPGLVDVKTGVTRYLPNMPTKWQQVPAGETLARLIGCPVRLLNDVRTATLGELVFGRGQSVGSMVLLALGTGIGGGIVFDGKLRLGPVGAAGELGHMTIIPDGHLCGCGNRGCLETLVSGPAIAAEGVRLLETGLAPELHRLVDGDAGKVTPLEMKLAAEAGDQTVQDAIRSAANYLGIGVANLIVAVHPDLVVIGGGVANLGAMLIDQVRLTVTQRVRMVPLDTVRIELSALGERAGILGAIALASRGM
jgi:glucokinase